MGQFTSKIKKPQGTKFKLKNVTIALHEQETVATEGQPFPGRHGNSKDGE